MAFLPRLRERVRRIFRRADGTARSPLHLAQRQVLSVRGRRAIPTLSQWRELPRYLSASERRLFTIALSGIIVAVGLLGYRLLIANARQIPTTGGSYTEGLVGTPQYLNPLYAIASDTDTDLTRLLFTGLMRWDPEQGIVPDLAESFAVSEDQKTYTFTLRNDAYWHDGAKVTTDDVVFTIQAIQNPEYRSPLAVSFGGVAVEATDERTVTFSLAEPFTPFLSTLTVGIIPAQHWQNIPATSAQLALINRQPIGTGPYMLKKSTLDQRGTIRGVILERNPSFYRGAPYIETLTFNFYNSTRELTEAIKNKNVEGAGFIPFEDARALSKERDLQILNPSLPQFTAVFFNQDRSSVLADDKVRTALNQATDRGTLVTTTLGGQASTITSPVLPNMPGYDATTGAVAFDTAAAIATLENAGWTLGEGATVRAKGSTALSFTMTVIDTVELRLVAEALRAQWAQIGADVALVYVDTNMLQNDTLRNRSYDALLTGELYGADPDPYPFWHSSQVAYPGLNLAQFSSRKGDDAIETARTSTDIGARTEAYKTLGGLIAEETPAVFLYQPTYTYATTAKIKNIVLPVVTAPADRFSRVNEWYMKTRRVFFGGATASSDATLPAETGETPAATTTDTPAADSPAVDENP